MLNIVEIPSILSALVSADSRFRLVTFDYVEGELSTFLIQTVPDVVRHVTIGDSVGILDTVHGTISAEVGEDGCVRAHNGNWSRV